MEKIKQFLISKKLCDPSFIENMDTYFDYIDPEMIEFCGCYIIDGKFKAKIPNIIDEFTRSVAIHELGHLYDYYTTGDIIEDEERSLMWGISYLKDSKNHELLSKRLNEISGHPNNKHK